MTTPSQQMQPCSCAPSPTCQTHARAHAECVCVRVCARACVCERAHACVCVRSYANAWSVTSDYTLGRARLCAALCAFVQAPRTACARMSDCMHSRC
eukprot:3094370-Pleurochrysis_carterae.AAC.2